MPQEIRQQPPGTHWDLRFSHSWQAFPSHKTAVVRLGGETAPQSIIFMGCAGQEVCVHCRVCTAQSPAFPCDSQAQADCSSGDKWFNEPHQRQMLYGEYHRAVRSPPAVSQDLIFEVTRRYRMVPINLIPNTTHCCFIGVQFLAMALKTFWFSACFLAL